nr:hypothetical protein [Tanacetum cinerariifolium]
MANENVPAPTRSDDQILPFDAWVPIGKSNFVLDLHKKKENPIFQISCAVQFYKVKDQQSQLSPITHPTPTGAPSTSPSPFSSPPRSSIRQETEVPQPSSPTHTYVADEAASTGVDVRHGGAAITVTSLDVGQGSGNIDKTPTIPHDLPFPIVNTLGSDEGSMTLQVLTVLCTTLSQKVESLEAYLKQTKQVYATAYTKLIMKVKKLEKTVKIGKARRKAHIFVSDDEEEFEDPSKQGRTKVHTYARRRRAVSTRSGGISTAIRLFSTAEELVSIVGASMPVSTEGMIQEVNIATVKNKGKGIMTESEPVHTKTKRQQEQERLGLEAAEEWENIRARVEADEELTQRLQAEEMDKYKAEEEIEHEGSKKQKTSEASGSAQEQLHEEEKELSQEDLQQLMIIVLDQEMNVESLQTKYPIIDWEIYTEDTRKY